MITYEYRCTACEYEFEQMMPISQDNTEIKCPSCEEPAHRHFRTPPSIDTYFEGSTKDQHPVPGI